MLTLAQILPDAQRILGSCDQPYLLARINDAVEILNNKGDFDSALMVVDLAVSAGGLVPMPPEVETVLAINIMGRPSVGYDRMFNFHLDGPGDLPRDTACRFAWKDDADSPVFQNPNPAGRLLAVAANAADAGTVLTIYGYDQNGDPLGVISGGVFVPGFPVTVAVTAVAPAGGDPVVTRITRVTKPDTVGRVTLFARDPATSADQQIAIYRSNWKEPMFRTVVIDKASPWVRVLFRKRLFPVASATDLIPLHSSAAVLMMLRALKYYDEGEIETAQAYEATGMRWLEEENRTRRANLRMPPQVEIEGSLLPGYDQLT